jgi:iron-sulfur cluster insertion protein
VFIQGGGCSGMIYGFKFAEEINPGDTVVEVNKTKLLVDPISVTYLEGATIDFKSDLMGSAFTIDNPQYANTCSCGSSFEI